MRKVPPSVMVREQIEQALFSEGLDANNNEETNLLSTLARLGLSYLVQQALEQEQEDFLGRGHYKRRQTEEQTRRGYRNGYEEAGLATAEGKVNVRVPQVRDASSPYRSRLMEFLSGNSEALERLTGPHSLALSPLRCGGFTVLSIARYRTVWRGVVRRDTVAV